METYLGRFLSADHISSRVVHFYSEYVSLHFRIVPRGDQVRIDIDALQKGVDRPVTTLGRKTAPASSAGRKEQQRHAALD